MTLAHATAAFWLALGIGLLAFLTLAGIATLALAVAWYGPR